MLEPITRQDLKQILPWRNDPQVRNFSFNKALISWSEHCAWWEKIKNDSSKKWMIFNDKNQASGVVNFYDIRAGQDAFWGFYFSDKLEAYDKLKVWFMLEKEAIDYAFENLQLKSLKCEVFKSNKAALFMHKKSGFQEVKCYEHIRGEVIILELKSPL